LGGNGEGLEEAKGRGFNGRGGRTSRSRYGLKKKRSRAIGSEGGKGSPVLSKESFKGEKRI